MKTLFVLLATGATAFGGEFVNLDFESPDLSHVQASSGPTTELLRGWTLKREDGGGIPPTKITTGLVGPLSLATAPKVPGTGVTFAKYELYIGPVLDFPIGVTYQLSQHGMIPAIAGNLGFYLQNSFADPIAAPDIFQCLINGEAVSLQAGPAFSNIYYADISAHAGREVDLEFIFGKQSPYVEFDIAGFTSIPEPSTYALFGFGVAMVGWHLRRRKLGE